MHIEIGEYRAINKGALKAAFTLILADFGKLKIRNCKLFESGAGNKWFKLPDQEGKSKDGSKVEYFQIMTFLDRDFEKQVQSSVLNALSQYKNPEVTNVASKDHTYSTDLLQSDALDLW